MELIEPGAEAGRRGDLGRVVSTLACRLAR